MDTVASKKLTREGAMKVLGAAVDRAQALDCHVSIAVVDDGGHLIAFYTLGKSRALLDRHRPGQGQERGFDEIPFGQEKSHGQ